MSRLSFFHLGSVASTSRLAEWAPGEMDMATITCSANEGHERPGRRLTDLSIVLLGNGIEDFVWTWYGECLMTDCVLDLFRTSGFTGFDVKPAKARYQQVSQAPPRLWELVVTGWAGVAPPESGIRLIESCATCEHRMYSVWTNPEKLVTPSQWDGSDIFMVWPLPMDVFVTERVARLIRDRSLTGCVLRPLQDLVFPAQVAPTLTPGRLSDHMPEQRARELGEPLGIY